MAKKTNSSPISGNSIWFVSHPYREPAGRSPKGICLWNDSDVHKRKKLHSENAKVIDNNGNVQNEKDITFIGEWECCSSYIFNNPNSAFKRLHTPFYTNYDRCPNVLNTDPFVFGKEFYYSCCKLSAARFNNIQINDIVLFGSYEKKANIVKIDTVFVVGQKVIRLEVPYFPFPSGFFEVTLSKIPPVNGLCVGKMYNEDKSLFSFVPCNINDTNNSYSPENDQFTPFSIDYDKFVELFGLDPANNKNHADMNGSPKAVFDKIVQVVQKANYQLGIEMHMPESYDVDINLILKKPLSSNNQTKNNNITNPKNKTLC